MNTNEKIAKIEKFYDDFFGTGYWEEQYKPHIVEFARQCIEQLIDKEEIK
jgi:hypothetical protein